MGSVCCCFPVKDPGEILDGSSHGNNIPPNSLIHNFLDKYTAFFSNAQMDALPSSHQEAASSTPNGAPENPEPESILAPPRTLAFNSDLRYANVQRDGIVRGLDKSAGVLQIYSALRGGSVHIGQELVTESDCGEESKKCHSESPRKFSSENRKAGYLYDCPSPDDEDVCPTCLEEYTPENPKIITHCSHHYHLSCIYEWMERSETCPVCCQVLKFEETK